MKDHRLLQRLLAWLFQEIVCKASWILSRWPQWYSCSNQSKISLEFEDTKSVFPTEQCRRLRGAPRAAVGDKAEGSSWSGEESLSSSLSLLTSIEDLSFGDTFWVIILSVFPRRIHNLHNDALHRSWCLTSKEGLRAPGSNASRSLMERIAGF